jgi:hypothetical protein
MRTRTATATSTMSTSSPRFSHRPTTCLPRRRDSHHSHSGTVDTAVGSVSLAASHLLALPVRLLSGHPTATRATMAPAGRCHQRRSGRRQALGICIRSRSRSRRRRRRRSSSSNTTRISNSSSSCSRRRCR